MLTLLKGLMKLCLFKRDKNKLPSLARERRDEFLMVRPKVVQAQTELVKWMQEAIRECKEQSLEPAIR